MRMLLALVLTAALTPCSAQLLKNCTSADECESFIGDEDCLKLPSPAASTSFCIPTKPRGTPDRCESGAPEAPPCCVDANCTAGPDGGDVDGTCSAQPACGGAAPRPGGMNNACFYDACEFSPDAQSSAARRGGCKDGHVCLPGGFPNVRAFPRNYCAVAACEHDTGCDDEEQSGGACQPFFGIARCGKSALQGFFCSYEASQCRVDQDCSAVGQGLICVYNTTAAEPQCQRPAPPPPIR